MEKTQFNHLLTSQSRYLAPQALKFTRDADDAKDLIQDTLLRAILNSDKFREGTNLKGWLYTIMRNLFVNNYRKRGFHTCPIDVEEAIQLHVENLGESNMRVEGIKTSLNHLPRQYYQPFSMYLDGYKYHEITERLLVPLGTIKNRIHIARKILKQTIS
ncbi:RNA polymerase sigma factor [Arcticibacter tournemirensis]|uniref:RNA polymerase sigma factor n=1 Tax=Arcticibacter tournemirensis TaxID=699437 RepID=A0A4Q0M3J7_9SPHI|nr:RNA polymerase sigma factor [Arcticibacter tournemirensis]RXF67481.1 RNA polymerase sigma factor [Arcticibacter tournemirensis]